MGDVNKSMVGVDYGEEYNPYYRVEQRDNGKERRGLGWNNGEKLLCDEEDKCGFCQ